MSKQGSSFNRSVHGARGLFAMMVAAFHVTNSGLPTFLRADSFTERVFFNSLKFGVELFFGISGFVIVGALMRAPSIRSFLWDRATRIYPLLWITLLAITIASLAQHHWLPPFGSWLLNFAAPPPFFALPQVNPAAWSLGYEITFYAICAGCWHAAARGWRAWRIVAILAGVILLPLFPRAILMPAGVVIGVGLLAGSEGARIGRFPGTALLIFLIAWRTLELAAPAQDIALANPIDLPFLAWTARAPLLVAAGAAGGLALHGIAQQRGLLPLLLRLPVFQWLGTISFSFYLWHPVVMSAAKAWLKSSGLIAAAGPLSQLLFAVVAIPPALVVAHFSQRYIEVRLTRRLRLLGPREAHPHAPITAAAGHGRTEEGAVVAPAVRA